MEQKIVFHGSNVEVATPRILQNGFYKDFGYGFYCTNFEKQAKRWAITRNGNSVVNRYKYTPDSKLKVLSFEIWNYVEGFISGKVPRDVFWGMVKFSYPTYQIVFCTEQVLKTLTFEGSEFV